jgi:RNase P subunit RPR2
MSPSLRLPDGAVRAKCANCNALVSLSAEDRALLDEARRIFDKPVTLTCPRCAAETVLEP